MPAPMSRQEREGFLAGVHVGVLSVNQSGRGPLAMPLWYVYEPGGEIVMVTRPQSRKAGLIAADMPVSFVVQSEELPPKYVSIEGRIVSVAPANVDRDLRPIAAKYLGAEVANNYLDMTRPNGQTDELVFRVRPGALVLARLRQAGLIERAPDRTPLGRASPVEARSVCDTMSSD